MASRSNDAIGFVQVSIRLGGNPRFVIIADESTAANPGGSKYRARGAGVENLELLNEVLDKMKSAYPMAISIPLCVEDEYRKIHSSEALAGAETDQSQRQGEGFPR